jgi:hypothetical protein
MERGVKGDVLRLVGMTGTYLWACDVEKKSNGTQIDKSMD